MRKAILMMLLTVLMFTVAACNSDSLESFNEDKELLVNRISELEEELSSKDEEIRELKNSLDELREERDRLEESINMIRFSAYARLDDYDASFYNLANIYRINSKHEIIDDWYVIQEENFELELLGYEDARKVDFYILRLESDEGERLLFSDTDNGDGWKYTNENISQIINKHRESTSAGFAYKPHFVINARVTLGNGNIIGTPKLPIYYK